MVSEKSDFEVPATEEGVSSGEMDSEKTWEGVADGLKNYRYR